MFVITRMVAKVLVFAFVFVPHSLVADAGVVCGEYNSQAPAANQPFALTGENSVCNLPYRPSHTSPAGKASLFLNSLAGAVTLDSGWDAVSLLTQWLPFARTKTIAGFSPALVQYRSGTVVPVDPSAQKPFPSVLTGDYLIPEVIPRIQQTDLWSQLLMLSVNEQQLFCGDSVPPLQRGRVYLSVISGQFHAVLVQPDFSDTQPSDWLNAITDSLLLLLQSLQERYLSLDLPEISASSSFVASGGSGGGDDDDGHNNNCPLKFYYVNPKEPSKFYRLSCQALTEPTINKKLKLLQSVRLRLQQAIASGNRDLALILRDRVMVISADIADLSTLLFATFNTGRFGESLSPAPVIDDAPYSEGWGEWSGSEVLSTPFYNNGQAGGRKVPKGSGTPPPGKSEAAPTDKVDSVNDGKSPPDKPGDGAQRNDKGDEKGSDEGKGNDQNDEDPNPKKTDDQKEFQCYLQMDFNELLEVFLAIPTEDYQLVNPENWFRKVCEAPFLESKEGVSSPGEKAKLRLDMAVIRYKESGNKDQARKDFQAAQGLAISADKDLSDYIRGWLAMQAFKKTLDGLTAASDCNILFAFHYFTGMNHDLVTLILLLHFGCLPGYEEFLNFGRAFDTMAHMRYRSGNEYIVYTPVSFTPQDRIRFYLWDGESAEKYFQYSAKLTEDAKLFSALVLQELMTWGNYNYGEFFKKIKKASISLTLYQNVCEVFKSLCSFMYMSNDYTDRDCEKEAKDLRSRNKSVFQHCGGSRLYTGVLVPFFYFIEAMTYIGLLGTKDCRIHPRKKKSMLCRAAREFAKAAEYAPNHWYSVFTHYLKGGMLSASARAAKNLSAFWQDKNDLVAMYWLDLAERLSGSQEDDGRWAPPPVCEDYDIDRALAFIGDKGFSESAASNTPGKSRQKKNMIKASSSKKSAALASDRDSHCRNQEIESPVGHKKRGASDKVQVDEKSLSIMEEPSSPEGWEVKSRAGWVKPHERFQYKHRSQNVQEALQQISLARENCDTDKERLIYKKIFDQPANNLWLGIERIWEEYAWTHLRVFERCFAEGGMVYSDKKMALQYATLSKNDYLLPALARILGVDTFDSRIQPESVRDIAWQTLQRPEYSEQAINSELRFRLRCLFSSIGHTYSLMAMANPAHSKSLGSIARQWFDLKRIDTSYSPERLTKQR